MSTMMGFAACVDNSGCENLLKKGKLYPIWEVKGDPEMWSTRGEANHGLIVMYRNRFDTPRWPDAAKEETSLSGQDQVQSPQHSDSSQETGG